MHTSPLFRGVVLPQSMLRKDGSQLRYQSVPFLVGKNRAVMECPGKTRRSGFVDELDTQFGELRAKAVEIEAELALPKALA